MKLLLSTHAFSYDELSLAQRLVTTCGFDGLELKMGTTGMFTKFALREFNVYRQLKHVPVRVVHAPTLFLHDKDEFMQAVDDGLAVARNLGATLVNVHPPSSRWFAGGVAGQ